MGWEGRRKGEERGVMRLFFHPQCSPGLPEFLPGEECDLAVDVDGEDVRLVGVILVIGVVG